MVGVSCMVGIYLIILSGEECISVDTVTGVCLILYAKGRYKRNGEFWFKPTNNF